MTVDTYITPPGEGAAIQRHVSMLTGTPRLFPVKITVSHWQLRDLISASSLGNREVLYSSASTIRCIDLPSKCLKLVFKTDYGPRCFKEANGLVVSGGLAVHGSPHSGKGLFSVHSQVTGTLETIPIGSLINNSVSITPTGSNQYVSHVCNNDQWLYTVDISNREIRVAASQRFTAALNHSSISPDHKMVVACGDSNEILLVPQDSRQAEGHQTVVTRQNCGFSTGFNRTGTLFTCCFQDGANLVYDVRSTAQPLHRVLSSRKRAQYGEGAFRVAKFSPLHDDLLAITEHISRVHLVDTRNFHNHQVVVMPSENHHSPEPSPYAPVLYDYDYMVSNATPSAYSFSLRPSGPSFSLATYAGAARLPALESLPYRTTSIPSLSYTPGSGTGNRWEHSAAYNLGTVSSGGSEGSSGLTGAPEVEGVPDSVIHDSYEYSDTEICGLDWLDTPLGTSVLIGTHRGITEWLVDSWSRRSFPSYSLR